MFTSCFLDKLIRNLKENYCFVASTREDAEYPACKMFMMPDGKQCETIQYEWGKCAEALFNPQLAGIDACRVSI